MEMSDWELEVPDFVRCTKCFSDNIRRYRRNLMMISVWYYKCLDCNDTVTKAYMAGFWNGVKKASRQGAYRMLSNEFYVHRFRKHFQKDGGIVK